MADRPSSHSVGLWSPFFTRLWRLLCVDRVRFQTMVSTLEETIETCKQPVSLGLLAST